MLHNSQFQAPSFIRYVFVISKSHVDTFALQYLFIKTIISLVTAFFSTLVGDVVDRLLSNAEYCDSVCFQCWPMSRPG